MIATDSQDTDDTSGIGRQRLKKIQDRVSGLPSLSTTVTKVMEICNNPKTSPNDLNRVISLDPVLTGRVLTLVNSAYYSLPKRVTSLTRAIIVLGLNTVKNLAISTAVLGDLGGRGSFENESSDGFWMHSLCVGVISKFIAGIKLVPVTEREEYFMAGLLHDVGKIPLRESFPEDYAKALEKAKVEQDPLHCAEKMFLQIDHCNAGRMIAEKWRLSQPLNDALSFHHNPDEATGENRQLVAIVGLGNTYANIFDIGSSGDPFPEGSMASYLLDRVGITCSSLSELREIVYEEIEKAKIFLRVS